MRHWFRVAAIILLAGCVLDQAWEVEIRVSNTRTDLSGYVFTNFRGEGNSVGCVLPGEAERVHASFVGAAELSVVALVESPEEAEKVEVAVFCDVDGDGESDSGAREVLTLEEVDGVHLLDVPEDVLLDCPELTEP